MSRVTLTAAELADLAKREKVSKPSVHYRPAEDKARSCGTCSMFTAGGSCTLVRGKIRPQDTCDEWESKSAPVLKARGSAEVLREYWRGEAHPGPTQFALERKIRWGEPDDWYRCVDELTPYVGAEGAKGYCNLRHKEVLGYYPSQHARMEREGKA